MKRMKLVALSAVLCMMLGLTAQAAGSSAGGIQVDGTAKTYLVETTNEYGETITKAVEVRPSISESSKKVDDSTAKAQLSISTDDYDSYTFDVELVDAEGNVVKFAEGQTYTVFFKVPNLTTDSNVKVAHWKDDGTREWLKAVCIEDGTLAVTFTSFSPVQILVSNTTSDDGDDDGDDDDDSSSSDDSSSTSSSSTSTTSTSPKTAESYAIYGVEAVAVLAFAGLVICRRKARG